MWCPIKIKAAAESLRHLLGGLWLSGLRLGESLSLTWHQSADGIRVNVDKDQDVCLMTDGGNQKNRQTLVYPHVDEFAEFLLAVPEDQRAGFIFNAMGTNGKVIPAADYFQIDVEVIYSRPKSRQWLFGCGEHRRPQCRIENVAVIPFRRIISCEIGSTRQPDLYVVASVICWNWPL